MKKAKLGSVAIVAMLTMGVVTASATLLTFDDGEALDSNLGSADNWNPNQVPTASDDLVIPAGFTANGNLGGLGTPANSVLINGTITGGNWALVPLTIDGGSITLAGAGGAFSGGAGDGTADLYNGGIITFTKKTASEVFNDYGTQFSIAGAAAVFGADPLVIEAGDNALITENAGSNVDNVTVSAIPEPATLGMVAMFGAGLFAVRRKLMM